MRVLAKLYPNDNSADRAIAMIADVVLSTPLRWLSVPIQDSWRRVRKRQHIAPKRIRGATAALAANPLANWDGFGAAGVVCDGSRIPEWVICGRRGQPALMSA